MRAVFLLLALATSASAAPLIGSTADLRSTPLCRTYTCTLLKTHTVSSAAENVIVAPGGSVVQYRLTAGTVVFDVWVGRGKAKTVTDVWARPRAPMNRAALPPAAELIRVTADISASGAMKAAEHWLKEATNPGTGAERLYVTPTIYVNAAGKDGNFLIILKND
ncbi:hypothetical protein [Deinococcus ficus]|uniref:Uncharacterized protein n=1 Tax=Deinococcus ficus TaxID=317577 RepID=A0A221T3D2_9DEIO|nr:hypothetical protein [Deinococcus ficus]ASN83412.1 hypothetical protein DFI_19640 [Deinococcus ficus]